MHCNFFRFLCKFCKEGACSFDAKRLWSAEPKGLFPLCGSKIHLRFQIAHEFYIRLCIAARTGRTARRVTIFECKHRQAARRVVSTGLTACGWLRGTSRTSPGPPRRWRRPVRLRSTSARGRGFAAYLSACGGQPLHRPRCGLRQGGLRSLRSASSLPFLVTCQRQVIPSHSFAALTALIVRRVNGLGDQPRLACTSSRTPPEGALACAPGSGTLPPHGQKKTSSCVRSNLR